MVSVMTIRDQLPVKNTLAAAGLAPIIFALFATVAPVAAAGSAVELVPHRASYRMALKSARGGSGETCDAWAVENNIYLKIGYAGGPEVKIAWSFAALESKNGRDYRFRLRHKRGGKTVKLLQGTATLDAPGGPGRARFKSGKNPAEPGKADTPTDVTIDLPKGTLFPTQHLLVVLKAGRDGTRFLPRVVFDGQSVKALALAAGFRDLPARSVRLAFFPVRSRKPEPEFEVGVDYRTDGLATKVTHDYGDFTIDMTPTEIELLARPEC